MLTTMLLIMKVCPAFGAPLIRRVIDNFVPDEFCPDPIPEEVFEALDSEVFPFQMASTIFFTQLATTYCNKPMNPSLPR